MIEKKDLKYYATGKRKTAIARVWLELGKGDVIVNKKSVEDFGFSQKYKEIILTPFKLTKTLGRYNVKASVKGGGTVGQVEALMYGVAKVLNNISDEYRKILKSEGLLSRDDRIVERKKYGKKKARKGTQYRKR